MPLSIVYITTKDRAEAQAISRAIVSERLVACANIIDNAESFYWWEGAVQHEQEAIVIAKAPDTNIAALITRIKELHSYTCPCIVTLPIIGGNPPFLEWIKTEARNENH